MSERLEPFAARVAAAAEAAAEGDSPRHPDAPEFTGCRWCPVCAFAAFVRGEHHDFAATVSQHSAALLAVLGEILGDARGGTCTCGADEPGPAAGTPDPPGADSAFVRIPVTTVRPPSRHQLD
nr:hypothetical protein [Rhodococcus sp. HNM0569]